MRRLAWLVPVLLAALPAAAVSEWPDPEPAPSPWDAFTAWPRLSLHLGPPGGIGLQAGAGAGIGGGQGGEGYAALGIFAAASADLDAPSWRAGFQAFSFSGFAPTSLSLGTACRLEQWGSARLEGCGPELDLMFFLLGVRVGWIPRSGRGAVDLGIGF